MRMLTIAALLLAAPLQSAQAEERWLHISVDGDEETVRVNLPLTLVTALAPLVADHCDAHALSLNDHDLNRDELVRIVTALRDAKDGEYVTVEEEDEDVRISKKGGFLYIHANEGRGRGKEAREKVEVRVPLEVVTALISGKKDELNLGAALEELAKHDTGDLVTVKDDTETVRIWIDRKSAS